MGRYYTDNIGVDDSWSFDQLTKKETSYASHGYHKYPAKFIPQLVSRLLKEYSKEGDLVLDPFGGCGTTLVEAKLNNRNSISIDVNDSAVLISLAKANAIDPVVLEENNKALLEDITNNKDDKNYYKNANDRLQYWFKKNQFNKLFKIYNEIQKEPDENLRIFYKCCFSNILKNCSRWYSKSIKPQQDPNKKDVDPVLTFATHLNYMSVKNKEYYELLNKSNSNVRSFIKKADARETKLPKNMVDLIITSPPYAISYEYADIHQLSLLWFGSTTNIADVRKDYIGTSSKKAVVEKENLGSFIGLKTIRSLERYDRSLANQIANYILDLDLTFKEMHRVLKYGKRICIIIGDTKYLGVDIPNTAISIELLKREGFKIEDVIKRKISSKTFTPYRGPTGKFSNNKEGKRAGLYQYEYIIIARKNSLVGLLNKPINYFYKAFLDNLMGGINVS